MSPVDRAALARRAALGSAVAGGSALVAGTLTSLGAAADFARRVLSPDRQRPDDTQVLAVIGEEPRDRSR